MKPLLITCGDPAGIGPEVALKALGQGAAGDHPVLLIGNLNCWQRAAEMVGESIYLVSDIKHIRDEEGWPVWSAPDCRLEDMTDPADPHDEYLAARGMVQVNAITAAAQACLAGEASGVVTMPIDKRANKAAGQDTPGHTEMLARLCGAARPVMMLFGPELRVVPLTTHIPYVEVPQKLTPGLVLDTLRIVSREMKVLFGLENPRMLLCGLNPHAGENGLFGTEEIRVLSPAVEIARQEGLNVDGPLPSDTAFVFRDRADVVICPTHDQALIPLKMLHFDCGVNTTLGLSLVRTSPDHGTARDIAWTGRADPCSAGHAIRAAVDFIRRRAAAERS
ncbi:MAG: 4-hydroxythreonine-4-phosphate dehydrogenase PdxA [Candidatus Lernaella stagnicola]|nr:4-hydroxythreonine-4-phosphate dehydrogenase PdxA [Candidatus Lernaella stagnicola]